MSERREDQPQCDIDSVEQDLSENRTFPKRSVLETVAVLGCSHRDAPIEIRERLAFGPDQLREALSQWRTAYPDIELVLLSTCNRIEMYVASDADRLPHDCQLLDFLCHFHGEQVLDFKPTMRFRTGATAVEHLFGVASSLDSMVVGEPQILSQVKQAYQSAEERETVGPILHQLFQTSRAVAKRITADTTIQQRRVSIPSVAVGDFAKRIFERFDDKSILVIGAGEMGRETIRYLRDQGAKDIAIVNRGEGRAAALAEEWNGHVLPWDKLPEAMAQADLVVSTTGAEQPIMTASQFASIDEQRPERPLFILDLAMPRDFEPEIERFPNVYLYSIDDLKQACEKNRRERDREMPKARKILLREVERFMVALHRRATGPVIQELREGWKKPMEDELQRLFNRLPDLDQHEKEEVSRSFDRLVNKLLHPPLESLRDESENGAPHSLIDALRRLFNLGAS
jgi:glutamyl-tRNA reductase